MSINVDLAFPISLTEETIFPPLYMNVHVFITQLCLTLCDPMDCNPPSSSVHGILQARLLKWVAIPFSRGSSQPRDRTQVSCIAGRFSTIWNTREAHCIYCHLCQRLVDHMCMGLFLHFTYISLSLEETVIYCGLEGLFFLWVIPV